MDAVRKLFQNKPYILAPLAGYTDLPFRLLCHELGADLVCSEMISSHGLVYGQEKTLSMLATVPQERPVSFQIFGSDPEIMGQAARIISKYAVDIIDINMGCPVRKVVKKGSGAALMRDCKLAREIILSVCANTHLPVSVKFRSGWNDNDITAPEFARMAQDAGACFVTVHARSWAQGFSGTADWDVLARVKKAVTIPVIGNGDILSYEDGQAMMAQSGCDGVMIGRGALGNPWVFQEQGRPTTLAGRIDVILRFLELAGNQEDPQRLLFRIKNHTARFLNGLHNATRLRKYINDCSELQSLQEMFENFKASEMAGERG